MSLSLLSTLDPNLSSVDKIKGLLGAGKLNVASADAKEEGGDGDGVVTADELSKMVRGRLSVLDLDSFGGMDGLNGAIKDFGTANHIDDAHSLFIQPQDDAAAADPATPEAGGGAKTDDAAKPAADDITSLKDEIAALKDEIKGLKDDLAKKEVDDLKAEVAGLKDELAKAKDVEHPHHHHHHHPHGPFGFFKMFGMDPLHLFD